MTLTVTYTTKISTFHCADLHQKQNKSKLLQSTCQLIHWTIHTLWFLHNTCISKWIHGKTGQALRSKRCLCVHQKLWLFVFSQQHHNGSWCQTQQCNSHGSTEPCKAQDNRQLSKSTPLLWFMLVITLPLTSDLFSCPSVGKRSWLTPGVGNKAQHA